MNILIIKLAALGDVVLAFGPFAAIRAAHPGARITLLTTPIYADLLRRSPWFDDVWEDGRPPWSNPLLVLRLARRLRAGRFDRVYDLQTSSRSSRYRAFVGWDVEWSGTAASASHPHRNPRRDGMHTTERQREQLADAGIAAFPDPSLDWLNADLSALALPESFCLLIPGASPKRPDKRWPDFASLAGRLRMPVVVCGTAAETALASAIAADRPDTFDLTGRTDLPTLAAVARRAAVAVGNDTGPTHLAAALGCPTLALFGAGSDPALCAPRGRCVAVLRRNPLNTLPTTEVLGAVRRLVGHSSG